MKIKLTWCGGEKPISQFPLGLGYLKANTKGHDIEIVSPGEDLGDCDLVGLSSNAWGIKEAVGILNSSEVPVVIGGQGTLWEGLKDFPFAHIVKGEGEDALQKILDCGGSSQVIEEPPRKDIDTLEFPERGDCGPIVPIFTSRGCPFSCNYCSSSAFWGKVRWHSAEYVIGEIEYLLERYPSMQTLYTQDDLFVGNIARFDRIFNEWMSRGWDKRLKVLGFARSSMMSKDLVTKMFEMGWDHVRFGAESGSNKVLKLMNKKATVEDNQRAIDICNEVGLPVTASFMFGFPGETDEDLKATNDFIERNKGKMAVEGRYTFRSFPGASHYNGEDLSVVDMPIR